MKLNRAIQTFLDARIGIVSPKTLRINQQYLDSLHALEDLDLAAIRIEHLRGWRKGLVEKDEKYGGAGKRPLEVGSLSPHTIHGHIRVIKQLFKWLHDEGYLEADPARRLEQVKLPQCPPKAIEEYDLEKMLEAAATSGMAARNLAFLQFLASTGCRVSGALDLKLQDLHLARATALVREKGDKVRMVYLTSSAVESLKTWLEQRAQIPNVSEYVFCSELGSRWSVSAVYAAMDRMAHRSGVAGRKNPHSFRHRLARNMLTKGASLGQVSRILGHSDIRVTDMFYGTFDQRELQQAHQQFAA